AGCVEHEHHGFFAAREAGCRTCLASEPVDHKILRTHRAARRRKTCIQHHEIGFALEFVDRIAHRGSCLWLYSPTRRNGAGISNMVPGGAYWIPPSRVSGCALMVSNRPVAVRYSSRMCNPTTRPNTTLLLVSPGCSGSISTMRSSRHSRF